MEFLESIINSNDISMEVAILRLTLSFIAGAVVGIDRQMRMHPAGLRTHTLICMGATLVMLISIYIPQTFIDFQNGDPGRIAAQAVSGIGFLGAGAIIKFGVNVRGLTTAASVWLISTVGLAIGCGLYMTSLVCILFILFILKGLDYLEKRLFSHNTQKNLVIEFLGKDYKIEILTKLLKEFNVRILSSDVSFNVDKDIKVYNFAIEISDKIDIDVLSTRLGQEKGLVSFRMISI